MLYVVVCIPIRRGVEQLAARRAHNPEAAGSSPAPAIQLLVIQGVFFYLYAPFDSICFHLKGDIYAG